MLKTGIYGADTPVAGELIRLLVNHPDVDLQQLYAPAKKGEDASAHHHGLIGEKTYKFSDRIDIEKLEVLFICRADDFTESLLKTEAEKQRLGMEDLKRKRPLKIIDLSGRHISDYEEAGLEYGLSEINRKPLVRGARRSVVPAAESSVTLVSLYPIAAHLLLSGDLELELQLPVSYMEEGLSQAACQDIADRLTRIQSSFRGKVSAKVSDSGSKRAMRMRLSIPCTLRQGEIEGLYDGIYDDHNFTWIVSGSPDLREVEGTQKCIVGLSKPNDGTLKIDAVADCRMRGGAGEAVHQMNLLCGLHERTGLRMKSISF